MPIEVGIWRMSEGKTQQMAHSTLDSESVLENILTDDISIINPDWMLIGRQVQTSFGKYIDLLAIDADGNLIVIELKRNQTPREVVAQLLDYGSWVKELEDDDIAVIFTNNIQKYYPSKEKTSLDEAFCENFSVQEMPEVLNDSHELLVVASELDDSTERIIGYLTDEYGVAINALFFRVFKDDDREYLSRAWMIDPGQAEAKVIEKRDKLPWNNEYYVAFGHDPKRRDWEDARKYGFVSAGGGERYTRALKLLEPGGRVWVNIPNTGYVGVGTVLEPPVQATDFMVEGKPITDMKLDGDWGDREEGKEEHLVRVRWLKTVPITDAVKEKGFIGIRNIVAKPKAEKWSYTIERLKIRFGVE